MAHTVLGIDLGAWSVKIAEMEAGFRASKVIGLYEKPLLPSEEGETHVQRAARTVAALIAEQRLEAEMYATTLGGEATLRLVSLPLADPKKIEQVLSYELEPHVLEDVEQLVIDNVIATTTAEQTNVIAVAAPKKLVKAVIDALAEIQADPRVIGAAALSYAALRGHAFEDGAAPELIIDLGHLHTHVCITSGGRVQFARSVPRGGHDVTVALADAFKLDPAAAEDAKHRQAFIARPDQAMPSPSHRKVDQTVRDAVRPLVRELRQTIAAYRAGGGAPVSRMLITGGAARLEGLIAHLESELGLSATLLALNPNDPFVGETLQTSDRLKEGMPAQALGLALAAAAPVVQVNLRKGELAYRSDYSYLRGKAGYMAAALLAILMFAAINAVASIRALNKEGDVLEAQLKRETTELFGTPKTDGKAVSEELRQGPKGGGAPQIPSRSAYDLLDDISRSVPPNDKGKLDISELEIKPKKVYLKGTAESAAQVDELASALEKVDCFEKVEKGKISVVTAPPTGDNAKGDKATEMKQFTLTINTTCN